MEPLRFIDLFCGLGAFHTAFASDPRFKCVFACDIDDGIRGIYNRNYGINVHGDIRNVDTETLPDFDILCAGFPCQPFSIAGNGEGFRDTTKGNLFYDILTIIDAKKPRMCILENVKNLKTHDSGRTYATIERELMERGYTVTSRVLNAADFGSPQARQRIFIVAVRGPAFEIPDSGGEPQQVVHILDPSHAGEDLNRAKYDLVPKHGSVVNLSKPCVLYDVVERTTRKGGRQGERVYDPNHVGVTVCASSGGPGAKTGLYEIDGKIRRLSVRETLGMFGFPQTYDFGTTPTEKSLFYLGNSIVVDVVLAFVPRITAWFTANAP